MALCTEPVAYIRSGMVFKDQSSDHIAQRKREGEGSERRVPKSEESSYRGTREFTLSPLQACVEGKTLIVICTDAHTNKLSHVHMQIQLQDK